MKFTLVFLIVDLLILVAYPILYVFHKVRRFWHFKR
jgi:hypothetical protein